MFNVARNFIIFALIKALRIPAACLQPSNLDIITQPPRTSGKHGDEFHRGSVHTVTARTMDILRGVTVKTMRQ